jgi:hypothetical protein
VQKLLAYRWFISKRKAGPTKEARDLVFASFFVLKMFSPGKRNSIV